MPSNLYNPGLEKLLNQSIDFATQDIRVLIVSPAYTFNKAHEFVNDVAANEVTNDVGTGYERKVLGTKAITLDAANDRVFFDAANPVYTSIKTTQTLAAAVVFKQVTDDTDSPLIALINFADLITNGSDVELQINAGGLFRVNNDLV